MHYNRFLYQLPQLAVMITDTVKMSILVADISANSIISTSLIYRTEGNFGGGKSWRIWQMTMNSPNLTSQILCF